MKQTKVREQGKYQSPKVEIKSFSTKDLIVMSGETASPIDVDVAWNSAWN